MLPASNKGAGQNMGFPDVCLTPAAPSPIPVPYPNIGMHAMAAPFCPTILLQMMPALNMSSMIPMTMGDEAGVANPLYKMTGMFTMGSPKVLLQAVPAITMGSLTTGNNMNNPVGAVIAPGAATILFTLAGGPPEVDLEALAARVAATPDDLRATRRGDGALVLSLRVFSRGIAAAVHAALSRAEGEAPVLALVFDLRGNPGGELAAFVELARDMLPAGATIATVVDADGDRVVHRARGDRFPGEVTVLVDGGTASAAELFAGCLQGHGRARVVGTRTYGKGTAHAAFGGPDGELRYEVVGQVLLPPHDAPFTAVVPDAPHGAVDVQD